MSTQLRIAIQKSGRLSEASKKLLEECGIRIQAGKNRLLAPALNFPLEVLYLRDDDIPQYVEDGIADIGILGENVVEEKQKDIVIRKELGFSRCRLSLAIPKADVYESPAYFQGKRIATSYPNMLAAFLQKNKVQAEIHNISGSVEIAPSIGLADGVCDLVSSGSTLFSNGLKEVEVIMKSQAVLVASQKMSEEKTALLEQLLFRVDAVNRAQSSKYIILNAPNDKVKEIAAILPGMRSPSVVPLADSDWCAMHSVVNEEKFWEIIDQLRSKGAEGILVAPIEKMIL